jgi:type II secretory pathway component GspD/PulD (secretin)
MMKGLDSITPQVLIEAKFIEASLGATDKMGINWGTGNIVTASGAKRPTSFPYKAADAGSLGTDSGSIPQNQVTAAGSSSSASSTTTGGFPTTFGFPYTTSTDFSFGTLDFSQLTMALSFLKTRSDSKLISSPRIVTTDNNKATIQVGEERRILKDVTTDPTSHAQTSNYDTKNIGVILVVTPHVTPDGHIQLNLQPQVSQVTGTDANSIPIIGTRNADTTVMIRDGQTIVIGGLISSSKTEAHNALPFLSDIPLLGSLLFKSSATDPNTKTELLIFVTARILHDNESSPVGLESPIVTSPKRPFKLDLREVNTK